MPASAFTTLGFHSCPISNTLEQQYLLDTLLYQAKLKEDQYARCERGEERLVWMVRLGEGLAESRLGLECYKRLYEHVSKAMLNVDLDLDYLEHCLMAVRHATSLIPRVYAQIVLVKKMINNEQYDLESIKNSIDGVLNPIKGLYLRNFVLEQAPQVYSTADDAFSNACRCVTLWSRWTRYGSCGDIEVREWEREQLYELVEKALRHYLSLARSNMLIFETQVIDIFISQFLSSIVDSVTQTKVFLSILDNVPKALTSKYLEKLLLATVRFSLAANITILLQRLVEDSFGEGSVDAQIIWDRIKEIISMRPELDLNDSLYLCNTVLLFGLKEAKSDLVVAILKFIDEDLLEDIKLGVNEPASYYIFNLLEVLLASVREPNEVELFIPSVMSICKKMDKSCIEGLGLKALTSLRGLYLADWTAMSAFLSFTNCPSSDIITELLQYYTSIDHILPYFKPYPGFIRDFATYVVTNNIPLDNADILKDILEPPQLEYFELYLSLLSRFPTGRDRYDLIVNDISLEKIEQIICNLTGEIDDVSVILERLFMLSKRLLLRPDRLQACLVLLSFEQADQVSVFKYCFELALQHGTPEVRKSLYKHGLGLPHYFAVSTLINLQDIDLKSLLDPLDPEYQFLSRQLPSQPHEETSAFSTMPAEPSPFDGWT